MRKLIIFKLDDLLKLLTHYTDGEVPPNAEARGFSASKALRNWLSINARAKWPRSKLRSNRKYGQGMLFPLHIRYEGKRIMTWDEKGTPITWSDERTRS